MTSSRTSLVGIDLGGSNYWTQAVQKLSAAHNTLLDVLFACPHRNTTFPITPSRRTGNASGVKGQTYVACLDCGRELAYDWATMRQLPDETAAEIPVAAARV